MILAVVDALYAVAERCLRKSSGLKRGLNRLWPNDAGERLYRQLNNEAVPVKEMNMNNVYEINPL